jgi:hypothetical protein
MTDVQLVWASAPQWVVDIAKDLRALLVAHPGGITGDQIVQALPNHSSDRIYLTLGTLAAFNEIECVQTDGSIRYDPLIDVRVQRFRLTEDRSTSPAITAT